MFRVSIRDVSMCHLPTCVLVLALKHAVPTSVLQIELALKPAVPTSVLQIDTSTKAC